MPKQTQPPLAGAQRYNGFAVVPDGLYTLGNQFAPLYRLDQTVQRKLGSPAQADAARRASALQYVCRWCGYEADQRLGRGRLCDGCRADIRAYAEHLSVPGNEVIAAVHRDGPAALGVAIAGRTAAGPNGEPLPVHLAVVRLADQRVLL